MKTRSYMLSFPWSSQPCLANSSNATDSLLPINHRPWTESLSPLATSNWPLLRCNCQAPTNFPEALYNHYWEIKWATIPETSQGYTTTGSENGEGATFPLARRGCWFYKAVLGKSSPSTTFSWLEGLPAQSPTYPAFPSLHPPKNRLAVKYTPPGMPHMQQQQLMWQGWGASTLKAHHLHLICCSSSMLHNLIPICWEETQIQKPHLVLVQNRATIHSSFHPSSCCISF